MCTTLRLRHLGEVLVLVYTAASQLDRTTRRGVFRWSWRRHNVTNGARGRVPSPIDTSIYPVGSGWSGTTPSSHGGDVVKLRSLPVRVGSIRRKRQLRNVPPAWQVGGSAKSKSTYFPRVRRGSPCKLSAPLWRTMPEKNGATRMTATKRPADFLANRRPMFSLRSATVRSGSSIAVF